MTVFSFATLFFEAVFLLLFPLRLFEGGKAKQIGDIKHTPEISNRSI
jgi:hypothetical protein